MKTRIFSGKVSAPKISKGDSIGSQNIFSKPKTFQEVKTFRLNEIIEKNARCRKKRSTFQQVLRTFLSAPQG